MLRSSFFLRLHILQLINMHAAGHFVRSATQWIEMDCEPREKTLVIYRVQ